MKKSSPAIKSSDEQHEKSKAVVPQVVSKDQKVQSTFAMDGTGHTKISIMQNIFYSKEIIEEARKAFDITRLKNQQTNESFLAEGERQINKLGYRQLKMDPLSRFYGPTQKLLILRMRP